MSMTRGTMLSLSPAELASKNKTKRVRGLGGGTNGRKVTWNCKLGEKRFALNLTLRDIEAGADVSSAVLCAIEHGTDPQLTTARRIAKFFGCSVEEMWPELAGAK